MINVAIVGELRDNHRCAGAYIQAATGHHTNTVGLRRHMCNMKCRVWDGPAVHALSEAERGDVIVWRMAGRYPAPPWPSFSPIPGHPPSPNCLNCLQSIPPPRLQLAGAVWCPKLGFPTVASLLNSRLSACAALLKDLAKRVFTEPFLILKKPFVRKLVQCDSALQDAKVANRWL